MTAFDPTTGVILGIEALLEVHRRHVGGNLRWYHNGLKPLSASTSCTGAGSGGFCCAWGVSSTAVVSILTRVSLAAARRVAYTTAPIIAVWITKGRETDAEQSLAGGFSPKVEDRKNH